MKLPIPVLRPRRAARPILSALVAAAWLAIAAAPTPVLAQDESAIIQGRHQAREMASDALSTLYEYQPAARFVIEHAAGYAVFSTFGLKLLFAGGSQGKGIVFDNRTQRQTFMTMVGVQAGLGFGIKKDRLIFVFENAAAMRSFINQGWEFGASSSLAATADNQGAMFAGAVAVSPGIYVYQITEAGLAAQITATGTKFFKDASLN